MKHVSQAVGCFLMMFVVATHSSYSQPVASFDFNEGSGETVSSTEGNLEGTFGFSVDPESLAQINDDSPSGAEGDTSLFLPGSDGLSASVEVAPVTDIIQGPMTMETWVTIDEFDETWEDIFRIGNTVKLGFNNGNLLFTTLGVLDWFTEVPMPVGEWHHFAVVWTPEVDAVFYFDGEEVAAVADDRPARTPQNDNLSIGSSHTLSSPLNGSLDRFRIHQAALTPDQLDSDPANPMEALDSTVIFYDFNQELPVTNVISGDMEASSMLQEDAENSAPEFSEDAPTGEEGDFSVFFAGEGQRIIVPDPDGLLQMDINQDFTIEAYLKFDELPQGRSIILSYGLPGGYSFSVTDERNLFATTYGIKDFTEATDAIIPEGNWHHGAVVHDFVEGQMRFYIDGELMNTVEYFDGVNFSEDQRLTIGVESGAGSNAAGLPYQGYLDRIRVHSAVVNPEDFDLVDVPTPVQDWPVF